MTLIMVVANYKLNDIPVGNYNYNNISKIYVLKQFHSAHFNRYHSRAYAKNVTGVYKNEDFVVVAALQSPKNSIWFQGTANAMDYERFIQADREIEADITMATLFMDEKHAIAFGLVKIDEEGCMVEFAESFKEMEHSGLKPDIMSIAGILSACSHMGLVKEKEKRLIISLLVMTLFTQGFYGIEIANNIGLLNAGQYLNEKYVV
ncbi:glucose-1-phosphate adenylyltransferase small subunit, chloroplastic/amyloplastic-like [Juglans microcarpa x Juglans regia]|uniref:glucose-1-phosphate adenylyltransferase small subunit, chloroplastic/amyloplastic-like n=1 Tax=Juglans microcarpa x Juglans regia TaxID=2249226 RepID=UPI001B7E077C|nr:glucose-1-phosphate adenylyltransferase small subunit, chloroplastic/amyloplastic-like [Juglans microcarpa x Juglans regia]